MKKYKIHILLLRFLLLPIPLTLSIIASFLNEYLDMFCQWLSDILPDPKK